MDPLLLIYYTLSWLRKELSVLPVISSCLFSCRVVLYPMPMLNLLRLCCSVISFYLLVPLSLQLVKQPPLTNPAVILENSLLAGLNSLPTVGQTLYTACLSFTGTSNICLVSPLLFRRVLS